MIRIPIWLVAVTWLLPAAVSADPRPAQGKFLVATDVVQGELFAETVVLLLHYDETGAFGLVVNRPTDVELGELLADEDGLADYRGTLFWGGPVQMDSLRALLYTDDPPDEAEKIIESVYLVPSTTRSSWARRTPPGCACTSATPAGRPASSTTNSRAAAGASCPRPANTSLPTRRATCGNSCRPRRSSVRRVESGRGRFDRPLLSGRKSSVAELLSLGNISLDFVRLN